MANRGIPKREVDEYEVWEIGAVFGAHVPDPEEAVDPRETFDMAAEVERARLEGRAPRWPKPADAKS